MDNTSRNVILGIVAIVVLGLIGFALFGAGNNGNPLSSPGPIQVQPQETALPETDELRVDLKELNNSTQSGEATIREENGRVVVTLNLDNSPDTAQPAHIHTGACPEPGVVLYPLTNVVSGKSETTLDITMDNLREQKPLAINVHKSPNEIENYVACGDVPL